MDNVPKLRFPGFEGEWKKELISNIGDINPRNGILPEQFLYIDLESVVAGQLKRINIIKKQEAPSRAQRILIKNDILFQAVRPYQQNNYFFNGNTKPVVASTGYLQMRVNENPLFIYQLIHTSRFLQKVLVRCTGTSYPAINNSDFKTIRINYPSPPEQTKIANFLILFDKKTEKQAEKVAALEEYKKGLLQNIFSREIRFKNDEGLDYPEWNTLLLGDICNVITTGKLDANAMKPNGKYRFYTCAKDHFYIDDYAFDDEALLISGNGANVGYIHYYSGKFNAYQRTYVLTGFSVNVLLLKAVLEKYLSNRIRAEVNAGNTPYIRMSTLSEMPIFMPVSLEEQTKIANHLTFFDRKIEKEKEKLCALREQKKGLLQQMFV